MNRSLILWLVLSASSLFAESAKQITPIFRDQDKVCWVGDSITASGLYHLLHLSLLLDPFPFSPHLPGELRHLRG